MKKIILIICLILILASCFGCTKSHTPKTVIATYNSFDIQSNFSFSL